MSRLQSEPQELSCPICYESYSPSQNPPTIICSNRHSICAQCVGSLQALICPFCRAKINFDQAAVNQQHQNISIQPAPNLRQQNSNMRSNNASQERELTFNQRLNNSLTRIQAPLVLAFLIQLPLLIFDIIFAAADNDPTCIDNKYNLIFTARQYFLTMEILGLIFASFIFIVIIGDNVLKRYFGYQCLDTTTSLVILGKIAIWMITELILFFKIVKDHCSGGIYAYCLIQTIFTSLFIPILPIWYSRH